MGIGKGKADFKNEYGYQFSKPTYLSGTCRKEYKCLWHYDCLLRHDHCTWHAAGGFPDLTPGKKDGLDPDQCLDICIFTIIFAVIGARIYYVAFAWDYYKDNLLSIFNIRQGGLAIYGGVLAGILTAYIMCRIKKIPFLQFADLAAPGLLVGQIMGRWGNFFNREAFGQYTDGLFAMELPLNAVRSMDDITQEMLAHARVADGVTYVQVHPTFLYESLWNLALLIFILAMTKHKKFHGEFFYFYLFFYGLGRFWIEGLRTDQLKMWVTGFPVSQALALVLMAVALILFALGLHKSKQNNAQKL